MAVRDHDEARSRVKGGQLLITDCQVSGSNGSGFMVVEGGIAWVRNCTITKNGPLRHTNENEHDAGISVVGAKVEFRGGSISGNQHIDLLAAAGARVWVWGGMLGSKPKEHSDRKGVGKSRGVIEINGQVLKDRD